MIIWQEALNLARGSILYGKISWRIFTAPPTAFKTTVCLHRFRAFRRTDILNFE